MTADAQTLREIAYVVEILAVTSEELKRRADELHWASALHEGLNEHFAEREGAYRSAASLIRALAASQEQRR